jgi:hypothetical protein
MRTLWEKMAGWTVGAIAAIALIGGLAAATAQPVEASTCQYDGINFMGQQPTQSACTTACYAVHGEELEDVDWNPYTGCCRCFY